MLRTTADSASSPFATVPVGGVPFAVTSLPEASDWVIDLATADRSAPRGVALRLANAYCVALADRDDAYGELLRSPGVNFPDGSPVHWVMKTLARGSDAAPGRVRGPSFFVDILDRGRAKGVRHFFLGTTPETLDALVQRATQAYPGLQVAGTYAPPFGPVDDAWVDAASAAVGATDADIIWVALGTPKQDVAARALADRTALPCAGVGAAFDFAAGTKREAPAVMQRLGVEWAFRLASEPRRLWKRYLIGNVTFCISTARCHLSGRSHDARTTWASYSVTAEAGSEPAS